jgi:hypothetical protein
MLLKDDVKGLVDSINVLMTPQNFLNLHARLFTVHNEAFQNKKKIIEENVNTHDKIQDLNGALKAIYQESKLTLSDESLNAIKEAEDKGLNYPETVTFVDENNNPITAGPEFDKAMKAWKVLLDVTKKEIKEEKPAETTTTEGEEQEEELEPFDKNDVNTYPKSLLSDLEEMYELYQDAGLISEKDTFSMFLKSQTAKTIIQYAELKVKEQQERKEAAEKAAKEKEAGEAPTTEETTPTPTSTTTTTDAKVDIENWKIGTKLEGEDYTYTVIGFNEKGVPKLERIKMKSIYNKLVILI